MLTEVATTLAQRADPRRQPRRGDPLRQRGRADDPAAHGPQPGAAHRHELPARQPRRDAGRRSTTDLDAALAPTPALEPVARRRSLVVVVSDFISEPGWERPLALLAQRHEVVALQVVDPRELELPDAGVIVVEDAETGEQIFVDTERPGFRRAARRGRRRARRPTSSRPRAGRGRPPPGRDRRRPRPRARADRRARAGGGADDASLWPWLLVLPARRAAARASRYRRLLRRRGRRGAPSWPAEGLVADRGRAPDRAGATSRPRPVPRGAGAVLVALARPAATVAEPHREGTVILAFDVSNSMAAKDLQPTRLDAAKAAAREFVEQAAATIKIGVVAFGGRGVVDPAADRPTRPTCSPRSTG